MRIHAAIAVLALSLLLGLRGEAAPAPSDELAAKSRLETVRKKLPAVLEETINKSDRWTRQFESSIQSLRMIGPAEAKLTIRLSAVNNTGVKDSSRDEILVIYLSYYDGTWTTRRFEATWAELDGPAGGRAAGGGGIRGSSNSRAVRFLMAAVDEASEKE